MSAHLSLQPVNEPQWRVGFANLLRKELSQWWITGRWWKQSLIWLVLLNGVLALILSSAPPHANPAAAPGLEVFSLVTGIFGTLGVIIGTAGALVDEKQSSTAAWVLSKPVSRGAFVLAKLVAHGLGFVVTIILLQGTIAYLQAAAAGQPVVLAAFVGALALLTLNLLLYLTLTLLLGAFFRSQTPVLSIPVILLFTQSAAVETMPFGVWLPGALPAQAMLVTDGHPLPALFPVVSAAVLTALFTLLAVWSFRRVEL